MKLLLATIILLAATTAYGQPSSAIVSGNFNSAPSSGFDTGVGVGGQLNLNFGVIVPRFEAEVLNQSKADFDSGTTYSALAEVRVVPFAVKKSLTVQPFVSAGYSLSGYSTPQWRKDVRRPVYGAGLSVADRFVVAYRYNTKERNTVNKTEGWSLSFDYYQPLGRRWVIAAGWDFGYQTFYHPPCQCRLSATSDGLRAGAGIRF